ncbi:testisin isoform X2 [Belonocnema kinseyi]|uniref:testisin isoform X2 n=1 Tax=Belonocnema kinseyi TaxID=2817044 RepID=UPI00143CEE06|nr:testisin isoform X2 [Belonocnema kinseyi]
MVMKSCQWFLMGIVLIFRAICQATEDNEFLSRIKLESNLPNSNAYSGAVLAVDRDSNNKENNKTDSNLSLIRKRRFIRFPTGPGYAFEGGGQHPRSMGLPNNIRFGLQAQFPSWRQQKSFWRPSVPGPPPVPGPPGPEFSRPVMSHRTPRLIFRDNDFPVATGSGVSSNFFQSNQLPDLEEEVRESRKQKRPLWEGDDSLCADGRSCEFFLTCWMSSGFLEGTCGGLMYACCHRNKESAKASSSDYNLVDAAREENQLLATDSYPEETTNEDRCGISATKQTAQRRIVGGDEAGFGSFPWQAYIRIGSSRCGGTLVNRFHVVTAGHCVAKASARQVQVTLGDYVVNSASESLPAYTFGVREIRVHPYFKFTPQADRFDVAVLRLDRPVHYMPHIGPICLPEKNEDFLGQYGWAAGWGALQAGSRLRPKTLQAVDVPVIDNRVCERWHRSNGINVVIYDEMMCAGYRGGGKDSCQGDSGGPLMLEKTGRWYLIGIVSAGYSCAQPGQPGIYHRVAKTVDWITYVINS